MEKTLSVRPVAASAVFDRLRVTDSPKVSTTGGAETMAEKCRGAAVFEVMQGAQQCGAYALRMVEGDRSRVAWVTTAAGSLAGVDLVASIWPAIAAQARAMGAAEVAFNTRRRGLIRKAQKIGFEITAVTMRRAVA